MQVAAIQQQASAANAAAKYEAEGLEREADADFATGTRDQAEWLRRDKKLKSDMRASMASSGTTTTSPSHSRMLSDGTLKYNALAAMYSAKTGAQSKRSRAVGVRYEGAQAKRGAFYKSLGTVISAGVKYPR